MTKNVLIKREYDYAVRICAYLAGQKKQAPIPVSRITQLLAVSRAFANKIIFKLRQTGIIGTVQGKYGGIFLNKPADRLSVLEVLQALGFDSTVNECLRIPTICPLIGFCKIHLFFAEQQQILINNLAKKMISDLVIYDSDLQILSGPNSP